MSTRKPTSARATSSKAKSPTKRTRAKQPARAKARVGKKAIVGYFSPELSKQIGMLAVQEDTSIQAIVGEALDMLLEDRGLKSAGER